MLQKGQIVCCTVHTTPAATLYMHKHVENGTGKVDSQKIHLVYQSINQ